MSRNYLFMFAVALHLVQTAANQSNEAMGKFVSRQTKIKVTLLLTTLPKITLHRIFKTVHSE